MIKRRLNCNVREKSSTNTKVIGTKTGAVPWPITLVFPELKKTQSLLNLDCIHPVIILRNLCALFVPTPVPLPTPMPMPTPDASTLNIKITPLPPFLLLPLSFPPLSLTFSFIVFAPSPRHHHMLIVVLGEQPEREG